LGTPTSVKYSRVPGTPEDALLRIEEQVLPTCGLEYSTFAALQRDDDPWTQGWDLAGDLVPCGSRQEALSLARGWEAWGVSYLAQGIPGEINFHVLDVGHGSFGSLLTFDESMVYHRSDEFSRGGWLVRMLTTLAEVLGCDVCGYGPDNAYEAGYDALEPATVLARLRAGELFAMYSPQFHSISASLVSPDEITELLFRHPRAPFLKYKLTTSGNHVFSAMPP
jgi:hypothetical protein